MTLRGRWRAYLRRCRQTRLQELEHELGPYTQWGSGPYGASSKERRDKQLEVAKLRQQLNLPQESNWLIAPILRTYGIDVGFQYMSRDPDRT